MARVEWYADKFKGDLRKKVERTLRAVGAQMTRDIKRSMRGYGAYSSVETGQDVKGIRKTISGKKHYRSSPGMPPAVDTGRLRASISFNWTGSGISRGKTDSFSSPMVRGRVTGAEDGMGQPRNEGDRFTVVVGSNVTYSIFLELGTAKMAARPYIRPVYEVWRPRVIEFLKRYGASEGGGGEEA